MRTAAQETAPQIAPRDHSKEAVGEGQHIRFWWRGSSVQSSAYFTDGFLLVMRSWRYHEGISCFSSYEKMQRLGSCSQFLKISDCLNNCCTSFRGAQSASLHPELSPGVLKVNSCSSRGFSLCGCTWQMPMLLFSCWQLFLASASL